MIGSIFFGLWNDSNFFFLSVRQVLFEHSVDSFHERLLLLAQKFSLVIFGCPLLFLVAWFRCRLFAFHFWPVGNWRIRPARALSSHRRDRGWSARDWFANRRLFLPKSSWSSGSVCSRSTRHAKLESRISSCGCVSSRGQARKAGRPWSDARAGATKVKLQWEWNQRRLANWIFKSLLGNLNKKPVSGSEREN